MPPPKGYEHHLNEGSAGVVVTEATKWCMIDVRPVGGPDVPSLPRLADRAPSGAASGQAGGDS
jgi:hypothetical protein